MRRGATVARALLMLTVAAVTLNIALAAAAAAPQRRGTTTAAPVDRARPARGRQATSPSPSVAQPPSFAVGVRVLPLLDTSRVVHLPKGRTEPRTLVTYVRYPALGSPERTEVPNAPAARAAGPFPLVIFGHGYAATPGLYAHLLQSWARAGYVVAAPVFPLENANAPGGPDESDLINQPRDVSFVISRLLAPSSAGMGPLAGLIDPTHIAVAGHSDGGETALAVAYSRHFRDPRVGAAIILSGAEMPGVGGFSFPRGSPPLLATQGTADAINQAKFTDAFFKTARRPKYLLRLLGAEHLPPYTRQQPQLAIVERVAIAFLDIYLKRIPGAVQRLVALGRVKGTAAVVAEP
jgi:dienelactone hydrolase